MDSMTLFIASLAVSCIGALASVLLIKADNAAKTAGCLIGAVAAVLSFIAGLEAVLGDVSSLNTVFFFPFARLELLLNGLAGLIVVLISILAFAGFIYGLSYFDEYPGKVGRAGFFMNTFVASMMLVITADNVFWFLVAFELMSLTSYFLVVIEENKNSIRGGWLYFVIAHVGFVLIMASFLLMTNGVGGSFSFSDFRTHDFGPAVSSACFVLAFFGFGAKAGIIPLHSWLPQAHPEAPSNVSALMSGGMIKIGILGILKVGLDLLAGSGVQLWWGLMVLVFGSISSVLGVVYALHEHDIKRLLAYHSVENIGIILLGVGASMTAHALGNDVIATIALMAALYHTLNHAMFKGELFLGAGSLLYATGTRNMEKMGGLFRRMPVTAVCFLIGALAISAIPPLNGFVSEWFTYQSLFNISTLSDPVVMVFAVASAAALAITGALAVTCFVKAYGVSFASSPRSQEAANAKESPAPMLFSQMLLAAICVVLGIGSPVIAPVLGDVAQSVLAGSAVTATSGVSLVNEISGAATSTHAIAIELVVLTGLAFALRSCLGAKAPAKKTDPWACGYEPNEHMPVVATSFASDVELFMGPLYTLREVCTKICWSIAHVFQKLTGVAQGVEPLPDRFLVDAPSEGADKLPASPPRSRAATTPYTSATSSRRSWSSSCSPWSWSREGRGYYEHRSCDGAGPRGHAGRALLLRPRPCDSREDAQSPRSVHPSGLPGPREAHGASRVREFRLELRAAHHAAAVPRGVVYARHGPAHVHAPEPHARLW